MCILIQWLCHRVSNAIINSSSDVYIGHDKLFFLAKFRQKWNWIQYFTISQKCQLVCFLCIWQQYKYSYKIVQNKLRLTPTFYGTRRKDVRSMHAYMHACKNVKALNTQWKHNIFEGESIAFTLSTHEQSEPATPCQILLFISCVTLINKVYCYYITIE